jgi:hypothetical protein
MYQLSFLIIKTQSQFVCFYIGLFKVSVELQDYNYNYDNDKELIHIIGIVSD